MAAGRIKALTGRRSLKALGAMAAGAFLSRCICNEAIFMVNTTLIKRLSLGLAAGVILACGGSSGGGMSSDFLNKDIETHYNNGSAVGVRIELNAFTPAIVAAHDTQVASHH